MPDAWKRCSTCKKDIAFGSLYYVCSVSTCNRKRTALFFCSVECWEEHLPLARHREAWAVEETAPTLQAWQATQGSSSPAAKPAMPSTSSLSAATGSSGSSGSTAPVQRRSGGEVRRRVVDSPAKQSNAPEEILVVVSRFKAYVKARHGMNTSDGVFDKLSEELRRLADEASDHARLDGRKTLLDRDFAFLRKRK